MAVTSRTRPGFATLEQEISLEKLPTQGAIPSWLSGTLYRNGPARYEVGPDRYRHWFDGLAMLHRFAFSDGQVSYTNRYLGSQTYRENSQAGKLRFSEFATDPCRNIFGRVATLFSQQITDNGSVNVSRIGGQLVALTETPRPVAFDPQTLQARGTLEYTDKLKGFATTAHPHYDFERQEALNFVAHSEPRKNTYQLYRQSGASLERSLIGTATTDEAAYMHSFAVTENYLILVEFPLVYKLLDVAKNILRGQSFMESFSWKPARGTRFLVLRRQDGTLAGTFQAEAFFAFHHINAFERGGKIVLDLAAYDDAAILKAFYLDNLRDSTALIPYARLTRCEIDLAGGEVSRETLWDGALELPRINYRRSNTQDYRFVYGSGYRRPDLFSSQLVKLDTSGQPAQVWYEDECYPGEPVFVAAPGANREDEGVVLSVVLDSRWESSFLLILDAASFQEVGRAAVPHSIPFGFHGQYF